MGLVTGMGTGTGMRLPTQQKPIPIPVMVIQIVAQPNMAVTADRSGYNMSAYALAIRLHI